MKKCSTEGCNGILCAKGLCRNCYQKIYYQTEKGKSGLKKYQKAYFQTEKGKEVLKRYFNSEKGKEAKKAYFNSEKGKHALKKYHNSRKGKEVLTNARHKRRARKFNTEYQRFSPHDIFERDNWTCQICGEEIFSELKHPHHFSASIDHIVPLSKGGVHSPENVQAAHLICNIRKGNRVD